PNYTPESITTPAPNKLDIWLTFDIGLKYEVAFASLDHGLSPSTQMLSLNQTAVKPEDPSAEGWKFEGWYTDEALTKPYSFTTPVKGDIVLFAKWTERKVIPGDVDGSGAVDASDRMILARYLAGWEGYEAKIKDKAAADVDGNGKIEAPDRMILARYLAGWTGYDKYFK
ncbi:MAG: InlB B-repeat-containing protein, partial [Clostridia bacterium]|nr:InlB B-repeat-containing protein [Clostridia bacterium]